jgi:gluconate 2-dehydrogenase alpha chain
VPRRRGKTGFWKKATAESYQRFAQVGASGSYFPSRTNYMDLDPTYKDRFGRPLLRLTNDFSDNDLKMSAYVTERAAEIGHAMGAKRVIANPRKGPYSIVTTRLPTSMAGRRWEPILG